MVSSHLVQAPERGSVVDRSKSSYSSENVESPSHGLFYYCAPADAARSKSEENRLAKSQVAATTISARYSCADRVLRAEFLIANGSRFSW
jgi:hypothetical protein